MSCCFEAKCFGSTQCREKKAGGSHQLCTLLLHFCASYSKRWHISASKCVRFSEVEFGSRGGEIGADVDQMVGALGALDWRSLAQSTDHGHGPIMSVEGDHYFGHGPIIESPAMIPKFP